MTKIVLAFNIFLFVSFGPLSTFAQDNSLIRGFNSVNFDTWTQALSQENSQLPNYAQASTAQMQSQLLAAITANPQAKHAFLLIKGYYSKFRFQTAADYTKAATDILFLRQKVRKLDLDSGHNHLHKNISARKDLLYMMELMAEESLLVGSTKLNSFPESLEIANPDVSMTLARTFAFENLNLQSGDVVIFRSVGEGSSSFIALSLRDPHIASHSTVVYVSKDGKLLSPEAFIEDGVKLRDLVQDLTASGKARTYIYRLKDDLDTALKVEAGADNFVDEMYKRVSDPTTQAAFPYGFSMVIDENAQEFSCAGVGYEIYKRSGLSMSLNPYSKTYWSYIDPRSRDLFGALGINATKVPAPGDVESNANFQLVGLKINTKNLLEESIESAIVDSMLTVLDSSGYARNMEKTLKNIGNRPIRKKDIEQLANSGLLTDDTKKLLQTHMDQIPDSINIKQLVFFYMLNGQVTPKLRETMTAQWQAAWKNQGHIMGPVEIRQSIQKIMPSYAQPIMDKINEALKKLSEDHNDNIPESTPTQNILQTQMCAKFFA